MTYRYTPPFGIRVLQIVILCEAILRGIAFILTPQVTLATTDIVASAPIQVWGAGFITFAVVGLFGEALMSGVPLSANDSSARAWPSFVAHSGLMILYSAMTLAYVAAVFDGEHALSTAPGAMAVFAYVHWLFARRKKSHVT
ncbi:hypothetical protein [Mycolicibacterium aichiense]|uniref:Uncharacterized protein n=1 Tax=Mycolicibacterium aichiense TaxID=1799 RepID=A0A378VBV2_9MYCO|nr:hypothetical protein [Mycolicibacterium aichiense]QFG07997.1 hypothetical protein SEA_HERBERTWM_27 [Mycobacterium phage Herbertwm]MCV7016715.1 hypothetical protein [Mycolicibacterium aichiense]SUA14070.1 Uncharacterised protein [Mycolicibacterium aichiense]SUA14433.1 Uncharacterised protein [Mycolicibacterium aichiense]BBX09505.1 hypothetical protein MAIC_43080 [Mycolicibacterium aichiense]